MQLRCTLYGRMIQARLDPNHPASPAKDWPVLVDEDTGKALEVHQALHTRVVQSTAGELRRAHDAGYLFLSDWAPEEPRP